MAFEFHNVGDLLGSGYAAPQGTQKVTNLSAHVDGGDGPTVASATGDDRATLHVAAGIVLTALIALWLFGGVLFTQHRL